MQALHRNGAQDSGGRVRLLPGLSDLARSVGRCHRRRTTADDYRSDRYSRSYF